MVKQVLVICVLLTTAICNVIQPRDLLDEALKQLVELQSIVQGDILAAHTELGNYRTEFENNARSAARQALLSLQLGQITINQQLQQVKDLAATAGVDISTCTNNREDALNTLQTFYRSQVNTCISLTMGAVRDLIEDATYTVDVAFNKVRQLEWQINNCNENLLCISPILSEIQLDKIRLPQNIKTETLATQSLLATKQILIDDCANANTAAYETESNSVLADIVTCVNRIIG